MADKPKPRYRVLNGVDYPPNKRAEIGDVVDDLPGKSIGWLLDQGVIEKTDDPVGPAPVEGSDG